MYLEAPLKKVFSYGRAPQPTSRTIPLTNDRHCAKEVSSSKRLRYVRSSFRSEQLSFPLQSSSGCCASGYVGVLGTFNDYRSAALPVFREFPRNFGQGVSANGTDVDKATNSTLPLLT